MWENKYLVLPQHITKLEAWEVTMWQKAWKNCNPDQEKLDQHIMTGYKKGKFDVAMNQIFKPSLCQYFSLQLLSPLRKQSPNFQWLKVILLYTQYKCRLVSNESSKLSHQLLEIGNHFINVRRQNKICILHINLQEQRNDNSQPCLSKFFPTTQHLILIKQ